MDLPDDRVRELDALMAELNLATRKDLFNNALTLFEWAVKEKRFGRAIASVDEAQNKIREVLMPALEGVKPTAGGAERETEQTVER